MDVEDDLRPRRRPFQVSSHSNPQLVDVRVLAVVGGDGQGVGDGQQLQEERATPKSTSHVVNPFGSWPGRGQPPSVERPALGPASRAPRRQEAACLRTAGANPSPPTQPS